MGGGHGRQGRHAGTQIQLRDRVSAVQPAHTVGDEVDPFGPCDLQYPLDARFPFPGALFDRAIRGHVGAEGPDQVLAQVHGDLVEHPPSRHERGRSKSVYEDHRIASAHQRGFGKGHQLAQ
jgi:hypothetical protein